MATVHRLETGTYQVRWLTPERRWKKKSYRLKADADRFARSVENSKDQGTYIDPSAGKVTFQDYAEAWRATQVHRPLTGSEIEGNLRRHVYPLLGPRPIGAIRHSEIQALVKAMHATLAPTTVELIFRWVQTVFKAAVADRTIPSSPCRDQVTERRHGRDRPARGGDGRGAHRRHAGPLPGWSNSTSTGRTSWSSPSWTGSADPSWTTHPSWRGRGLKDGQSSPWTSASTPPHPPER